MDSKLRELRQFLYHHSFINMLRFPFIKQQAVCFYLFRVTCCETSEFLLHRALTVPRTCYLLSQSGSSKILHVHVKSFRQAEEYNPDPNPNPENLLVLSRSSAVQLKVRFHPDV